MNQRHFAHRLRGGTLGGMLLGLVLGVLISFGVVWYLNKTPLPFQTKQDNAPRTERPADESLQPLPGKPGDKQAAEKPRFEFYHILPGEGGAAATVEGTAPASEKTAKTAEKVTDKPGEKSTEKPADKAIDPVYLQAGAFQKAVDADNMKARLALMGIEAGVQQVTLADKGTVYRVRIGPFHHADELNRMRTQLSQGGIEASAAKAIQE